MASDLIRLADRAQLSTAGRFQRSGRILTRDLRKKEKLALRDIFWVYGDLMSFGLSLFILICSLSIATTWGVHHYLANVIASIAVGLAVVGMVLSVVLSNRRVNHTLGTHFSYRERREIVEGERSRRMAPHRAARRARVRELAFNYYQYSVDVRYDKHVNGVTLKILEHKPWKDGRYLSSTLKVTEEMVNRIQGSELVLDNVINGVVTILPPSSTSDSVDSIRQKVAETQAIMEVIAEGLEDFDYDARKAKLLTRRIALEARR